MLQLDVTVDEVQFAGNSDDILLRYHHVLQFRKRIDSQYFSNHFDPEKLCGFLKVDVIVIKFLSIVVVVCLNQQIINAGQAKRNSDGNKGGSYLKPTLLIWVINQSIVVRKVSIRKGIGINSARISIGCRCYCTHNASKNTRDSMEIMNTTSVKDTIFFFKIRSQIFIAQSGEDSSQTTDCQRPSRTVHYSGSSANNHPSRNSGVEKMLHSELVFEESTSHKGRKTAPRQGHDGVSNNLSLSEGSRSQYSKVKGRPVHPQEECPYECKNIRSVASQRLRYRLYNFGQEIAEQKSAVSSIRMNDHRSPDIKCMNQLKTDNFVQSVSDLVNQADNGHLERTNSSNCRPNVYIQAGCRIQSQTECFFIDKYVVILPSKSCFQYPHPKCAQQDIELGQQSVKEESVGKC